ncbi:MAG TPA: S41 family peptidase [Chloroflexota bacterium]|jgi:carboxyl-terminal processing protease|nr:S41 family peptidase [Chloroflexota bacterium]
MPNRRFAHSRWLPRALLAFVLVAASLVGAAAAPVPAAAQLSPGGQGRPTEATPELQILREAYALLLERYATPLDPAALVAGAEKGMTGALHDAGVAEVPRGLTAPGNDAAQQWRILQQRYQSLATRYGEVVPPRELAYAAIAGMAEVPDDSHTNFLTPEQYQEHLRWSRGEVAYGGIGARMRGPQPTVVEVFPDTPAERAGLRPGDVIVAVDGRPTADTRLDEVITWVRGEEGTSVRLSVQRAVSGQLEELTLVRARVRVPFVEARRLDDLGYVQLRGFPEPSVVGAVEEAIERLQREGVRGMILDLRGNSGGRIDVGTRLLSRFVPDGPIYQAVDRRGHIEIGSVHGSRPLLTVPLVVLVDEGTASMGELFAAAVQEHHVGRLIGVTTAGSVAASVVLPLGDGSALQLSVEQVYSGGGALLDKVGVTPDEVVELDLVELRLGHDAQLARAIDYLHEVGAVPAATR